MYHLLWVLMISLVFLLLIVYRPILLVRVLLRSKDDPMDEMTLQVDSTGQQYGVTVQRKSEAKRKVVTKCTMQNAQYAATPSTECIAR